MSRGDEAAPSLVGKLLIAEPMLGDPNFERSVVLMIEHTDEGALGVVLNRPTDLEVGAVLDEWAGLAADPPVLYVGGPVEQNGVIALGRRTGGRAGGPDDPGGRSESGDKGAVLGWSQVLGDLGTVDLHQEPAEMADQLAAIRFFAGYSGWGPGQLEAELAQDAWMVVDAVIDDVFAPDPETMWRSVLRRQGGKLGMLANFPPHPSMN